MKKKILYITRDKERADSMPENEFYSILSGNGEKDTLSLISDKSTLDKIKKEKLSILVFKNNIQIENIAKENNIDLLNPSAELAEKIENKITQTEWLSDIGQEFFPPHKVLFTKDIVWKKEVFVLQWAHSHTGEGTFLINQEKDLEEIKNKFPNREAKVTKYIKGPMFTQNIIVGKNKNLFGNISYQITGVLPFTDNQMSTIGNDWSVPPSILTDIRIEEIQEMSRKIADKMKQSNWKGLFGIDVIYDEELDKIYLIEINARQPASTTFESKLQIQNRNEGLKGITTFEAHIKSLIDEEINEDIIEINDGAQIVKRVTKNDITVDINTLKDEGYNIIKYNNTKLNSDLIRIQSNMGIMESHNKFNKRGKRILESLI